MLKIKHIGLLAFWLISLSLTYGHPVSMMSGKAVWGGDRFIINMEMTLYDMMLHYGIRAGEDGLMDRKVVRDKFSEFMKFVNSNFFVITGDTVRPEVKSITNWSAWPSKLKTNMLREYTVQFELRFRCEEKPDSFQLLHMMGERSKGLQSTALINFYFTNNSQFVPMFSDVPVFVDLVVGQVIEKKFRPVLVINDRILQIQLPSRWTAHGIPFELLTGQAQLIEPDSLVMSNRHNFSSFSFKIPEGVNTLELKWQIFSWQMRRIELRVKDGRHEEMMIISRFQPVCVIDLKKVASWELRVAD